MERLLSMRIMAAICIKMLSVIFVLRFDFGIKKELVEVLMKKYGIVTYNRYANFTNYGSALQTWALQRSLNKLGDGKFKAVVVDYCPDICKKYNILNPFGNIWDKDEAYVKECEKTLPAIKANFEKFEDFYNNRTEFTKEHFTADDFDEKAEIEGLDGFICGSDTIFCLEEFGFDPAFYSSIECMKNGFSISYAASFGDSNEESFKKFGIDSEFNNFNAISLREGQYLDYVRRNSDISVEKVIDPTLLLSSGDYNELACSILFREKYLLLYSRRHNQKMIDFADRIAKEHGWRVIDISLKFNDSHTMFYDAGVEEFLSLVKHAEFMVTNSFHGMIFATQYRIPYYGFSRDQCDTKISELMQLFGLKDRIITSDDFKTSCFEDIDFDAVHLNIQKKRIESIEFLKKSLNTD